MIFADRLIGSVARPGWCPGDNGRQDSIPYYIDNMKFGFVKVAAAIPTVKVADCKFNAQQAETQIAIADGKGVQIGASSGIESYRILVW